MGRPGSPSGDSVDKDLGELGPDSPVQDVQKSRHHSEDSKLLSGINAVITRSTYSGALFFNIVTFTLPALYSTLSKLWVAKIDAGLVATTDSYTYMSTVAEVLNEGLPRAAFLIIGDRNRTIENRLKLSFTLIAFQMLAGLVMSIAFAAGAKGFASAFVPEDVRERSINYLRISAWVAFTSATDVAVSYATRAMDRPDVPLMISVTTTTANIVLDFMFLSTFRIRSLSPPTIERQAAIRLACNFAGVVAGLTYFVLSAKRIARAHTVRLAPLVRPRGSAWLTLAKPGVSTFVESAIRNALYLWLIHGVVALGRDYATAWGVFNTIRWGLVMVPVQALEATAATFGGHAWNDWRLRAIESGEHKATWQDLVGPFKLRSTRGITRPALRSALAAVIIEVPLCLAFSFGLAEPFARYLSGSPVVARITERMWRTIDWCYIAYAVNAQLASIFLATKPRWFLLNSLTVNIFWVLPWAAALESGINITESNAWTYHATIFGGSLVLSFIVTLGVLSFWTKRILAGKMSLNAH